MKIACTDCQMYQSSHCDDCLVTSLLHTPDGVVDIDDELDGSLGALSGAGLIPVLRFRPRDPGGTAEGSCPPEGVADTA